MVNHAEFQSVGLGSNPAPAEAEDLATLRRRAWGGRAWEGGLISRPNPEHVPECEEIPDTQQTREKKTVRVKIFKFG